MPKQSGYAAIRERHKMSSAESDRVAAMLPAALQILDPPAGFNIGKLAERSRYSR